MTQFENKILTCDTCGEEFVFTADAQRYFEERKVTREPRFCKYCHMQHRKSSTSRTPRQPLSANQ